VAFTLIVKHLWEKQLLCKYWVGVKSGESGLRVQVLKMFSVTVLSWEVMLLTTHEVQYLYFCQFFINHAGFTDQ
jgi:hypothetical protein